MVRTVRERQTSCVTVVVLSDVVVGGVVGGVVCVVGCGVSRGECLLMNIVSQECCRSRANHDVLANATL